MGLSFSRGVYCPSSPVPASAFCRVRWCLFSAEDAYRRTRLLFLKMVSHDPHGFFGVSITAIIPKHVKFASSDSAVKHILEATFRTKRVMFHVCIHHKLQGSWIPFAHIKTNHSTTPNFKIPAATFARPQSIPRGCQARHRIIRRSEVIRLLCVWAFDNDLRCTG